MFEQPLSSGVPHEGMPLLAAPNQTKEDIASVTKATNSSGDKREEYKETSAVPALQETDCNSHCNKARKYEDRSYFPGPSIRPQHLLPQYEVPRCNPSSYHTGYIPEQGRAMQYTSDISINPVTRLPQVPVGTPIALPRHHQSLPTALVHKPSAAAMPDICRLQDKVTCVLSNRELWKKFHLNTTEMIITKQGRRMFPTLQFKVSGLRPCGKYTAMVDMILSTSNQWKFHSGRWISSGQMDSQVPKVTSAYIHPDMPGSGSNIMKQEITFAKMKLTNSKALDTEGQVILSSMHKYQPRIIIAALDRSREQHLFTFPETEFVAVTAYQNTSITQLKIDHNPFAKGFRDNSYDRMSMMGLEPMQAIRKPVVLEESKTTYQSKWQPIHRYERPTSEFDNSYPRISGYHQQYKTVNKSIYPTHSACLQQFAIPNLPQQSCASQINFEPMSPYHGIDYHQWYTGQDTPQTTIHNSTQQPTKHYIADWVCNIEDNAHLQKTFDQSEKASSSMSMHTSNACMKYWTPQQPPEKKPLWNNIGLVTTTVEQNHVDICNMSQERQLTHQGHQLPLLLNCSVTKTERQQHSVKQNNPHRNITTTQANLNIERNEKNSVA